MTIVATHQKLKQYNNNFKCSLDAAKRSFYRSFNAIFGKLDELPQMK